MKHFIVRLRSYRSDLCKGCLFLSLSLSLHVFDVIFRIPPPATSVVLTVPVTVSNDNRCVQFYGFNHDYQQQNVHFVEAYYFNENIFLN